MSMKWETSWPWLPYACAFHFLFMIWPRRAVKDTMPYSSAKFWTDLRFVLKLGVRIALVIIFCFDVGMAIVS